MNRWLAILILSIGTTILVSHAAIPHHHHDGVVCYHHDEGNDHAQEASHSHGSAHPLDFNCSLKQFYLAPANKREITPDVMQINSNVSSQAGLPVVMPIRLAPESTPLKLLFYHTLQAFPDPVFSQSGPRAPPVS